MKSRDAEGRAAERCKSAGRFGRQRRERARDADDALAMLKDPPPAAAAALQDAAEVRRR
jgi:hypothetical protein